MQTLERVRLACGDVEYLDTGGTGPVLVFLHGLLMDESLWTATVHGLRGDHRCVVPVLPLGGHRLPADPAFDLSMGSIASVVSELLERLDLRDVTLVGSDTGGAIVQVLLAQRQLARVARVVLVGCDAYDNFPPGLTGNTLALTGVLPPRLFGLFMQQLRLRPVRRLPIAFGWLTKRGDRTTRAWINPLLTTNEVRRDTVRVLRSIRRDPGLLQRAADAFDGAPCPALVVWAVADRVMPLAHARRLASALDAEVVEVHDSHTLVSLDQPAALTNAIRAFVASEPSRRLGAS